MSLRHAIQNLRSQTVDEDIHIPAITDTNGLCGSTAVRPSNSSCAIETFEDIGFSDEETDALFSGNLTPPPAYLSNPPIPLVNKVPVPSDNVLMTPRVTTPTSSSQKLHSCTSKPHPYSYTAGLTTPNPDNVLMTPCVTTPTSSSSSQKLRSFSCTSKPHPYSYTAGLTTPNPNKKPAHLASSIPPFNMPTTPSMSTPVASIHGNNNPRRFPGPAGCLPRLTSRQDISRVKVVSPLTTPSPLATPRRKRLTVPATDASRAANGEEFTVPSWTVMMKELDMTDSSDTDLTQYTIANTLRMANNHQLVNGKVPFLRVLVKLVSSNAKNMSALVKDETGEMLSTVHMKVWNEYGEEWGPGCCLILRQVSVFSPTPRKHYLNITLSNIVRLYPATVSEKDSTGRIKLGNLSNNIASEEPRSFGNNKDTKMISLSRPSTYDRPRLPSNIRPLLAIDSSTRPSQLIDDTTVSKQYLTRPSATIPACHTTDIDDDYDALFDDIDILSFDV